MAIRQNIMLTDEVKDIIIADIVLIIAFSLTFSGGFVAGFLSSPGKFFSNVAYLLPIIAVAVSLSFVLHELMHKFVAQHYGAIAGFKTSPTGLAITLITGALGFLLGIPGATMIYVHSFTPRQNGIVSLAGPLTNLGVFLAFEIIFLVLQPVQGTYLYEAISITVFISLLLAFFNMLPMPPLDGSKVLSWSPPVYVATIAAILLLIVIFGVLPLSSILYLVIIAIVISTFYRRVF